MSALAFDWDSARVDSWVLAPDVISTVTDAVVAEVTPWQQRPLDRMYRS